MPYLNFLNSVFSVFIKRKTSAATINDESKGQKKIPSSEGIPK
jgi:hypothetical protein